MDGGDGKATATASGDDSRRRWEVQGNGYESGMIARNRYR
jgi:hypothetical protein